MSKITPQQIRELADEFENDREDRQQILAALRTATDRLEAVRAWVDEHYHHFPEISELDAILAATPPRIEDMAPGTTFVGSAPGWNPQMFRVTERRHIERAVWRATGWATYDNSIDPSTIRDVTPPATTPEVSA